MEIPSPTHVLNEPMTFVKNPPTQTWRDILTRTILIYPKEGNLLTYKLTQSTNELSGGVINTYNHA